jgi:DNA-binding transcriptional MerR regulator
MTTTSQHEEGFNLGCNMREKEFTAKEVQAILRQLTHDSEKIGLALLNYYARTNLVPSTGKEIERGRNKYCYSDLILLCWLFRMKREGLPVNRFRRGLDYLRKRLPKLFKDPKDMVLLTDGKQLFLKHRENDKKQIAEVLTGRKAGQYVWAYAIGSLIEEVDKIIESQNPQRQAA